MQHLAYMVFPTPKSLRLVSSPFYRLMVTAFTGTDRSQRCIDDQHLQAKALCIDVLASLVDGGFAHAISDLAASERRPGEGCKNSFVGTITIPDLFGVLTRVRMGVKFLLLVQATGRTCPAHGNGSRRDRENMETRRRSMIRLHCSRLFVSSVKDEVSAA